MIICEVFGKKIEEIRKISKRIKMEVKDDIPIVFIGGSIDIACSTLNNKLCCNHFIYPLSVKDVKILLESTYGQFIKLHKNLETIYLNKKAIILVEICNRKLLIQSKSEKYEISNVSLSEFKSHLGIGFIQCHRCMLVNIDYITRIDLYNREIFLEVFHKFIRIGGTYINKIRTVL